MREINYSGTTLMKDLEFCKILREIKNQEGVFIVSTGNPVLVHECDVFSLMRTGKKHIGYLSHYVSFLYRGLFFSIYPSDLYPISGNRPGKWNFIPFVRVGDTEKHQCGYYHEYTSFDDIKRYLAINRNPHRLKGVCARPIDERISINTPMLIEHIVYASDSKTEREILASHPFYVTGDEWNSRRKIVNVVGSSGTFQVDLVSQQLYA